MKIKLELFGASRDFSKNDHLEFEDEKVKIMDEFISNNKSKFNSENLKFSSKLKK